jgi:hypothetical protein
MPATRAATSLVALAVLMTFLSSVAAYNRQEGFPPQSLILDEEGNVHITTGPDRRCLCGDYDLGGHYKEMMAALDDADGIASLLSESVAGTSNVESSLNDLYDRLSGVLNTYVTRSSYYIACSFNSCPCLLVGCSAWLSPSSAPLHLQSSAVDREDLSCGRTGALTSKETLLYSCQSFLTPWPCVFDCFAPLR